MSLKLVQCTKIWIGEYLKGPFLEISSWQSAGQPIFHFSLETSQSGESPHASSLPWGSPSWLPQPHRQSPWAENSCLAWALEWNTSTLFTCLSLFMNFFLKVVFIAFQWSESLQFPILGKGISKEGFSVKNCTIHLGWDLVARNWWLPACPERGQLQCLPQTRLLSWWGLHSLA